MKTKSIIPMVASLEVCKTIPRGKYKNTTFIYVPTNTGYSLKERAEGILPAGAIPAPTVIEIIQWLNPIAYSVVEADKVVCNPVHAIQFFWNIKGTTSVNEGWTVQKDNIDICDQNITDAFLKLYVNFLTKGNAINNIINKIKKEKNEPTKYQSTTTSRSKKTKGINPKKSIKQ